ncbi:MAG TPA: HlyD family secretion protein [Candidatus Binataceae bacterium]|nr:HlyD family secretion protein [Candidatus Binataceae bacterium]
MLDDVQTEFDIPRPRDSGGDQTHRSGAPQEASEKRPVRLPPEAIMEEPAAPSASAPIQRARSPLGRAVRLALGLALAGALAAAGIRAFNYVDSYEATDDAQVDGHINPVSSRIEGTVVGVFVENSQYVKAGDKLAEMDPRDYQIAVEKARADLAQAEALVETARRDHDSALARLRQSEATDAKASHDAERYQQLFDQGVASRSQNEESVRTADVAAAAVESDRAAAAAALKAIALREAGVKAAQAALDQALLNVGYTTIVAPVDGVVGKKTVEVGQRMQPGEDLMAVVPIDGVWVTANFKETQLRRIRPGQRVTISVDAVGREYTGRVEGLAGASGEKYSMIPPENATGNYVKVVQRFPVRIRLDAGQNSDRLLRPGMSVEPTVWVR